MNFPDKDHPIWRLSTTLVLVIVLAMMLTFTYASGFDTTKDTGTIVAAILAYLGADVMRARWGSS